jgi:hypothetical protein
MTAATYDISIDQGSDFAMQLVVKEDGVVKDLTNYLARSSIRTTKEDSAIAAAFTCTIPAPATGAVNVALHNSVSSVLIAGAYVYDLELYTTADAAVTRVIEGAVSVSRGVTR